MLERRGGRYVCCLIWKPASGGPIQPILYWRKGTPEFREAKGFMTASRAEADREDGRPSFFFSMIGRVTKGPVQLRDPYTLDLT